MPRPRSPAAPCGSTTVRTRLGLDPRGGDNCGGDAVHRDLQQSRAVRSDEAARHARDDRAGARRELVDRRHEDAPYLQAAPGRQVSRRQAAHRQGRAMYVPPRQRQGAGFLSPQPAQGLVREPEGGRRRQRPSGDVRAGAPAALIHRHARLAFLADLPVPCRGEGHARQADRHRPFKVASISSNEGARLVKKP